MGSRKRSLGCLEIRSARVIGKNSKETWDHGQRKWEVEEW